MKHFHILSPVVLSGYLKGKSHSWLYAQLGTQGSETADFFISPNWSVMEPGCSSGLKISKHMPFAQPCSAVLTLQNVAQGCQRAKDWKSSKDSWSL